MDVVESGEQVVEDDGSDEGHDVDGAPQSRVQTQLHIEQQDEHVVHGQTE